MFSTGRSTRKEATTKVSAETRKPRTKPPSEKASSSSSGEAGEESWSWIAPWNFCWRIEEELLAKELVAQAIMIRPGMTKMTYSNPCSSLIREPSAAPKTVM